MENIYKFDKLTQLGIKHSFIGKPYDFSSYNSNRIKDVKEVFDINKNIFEVKQVHSSDVVTVLENNHPNDENFLNKDGLITNVPGITLSIKTADCQSIFLYDSVLKVIGNIHSGWQGTLNQIVIKAIDKMINEFNCNKENIMCFINPSINQCHFEIEEDVLNLFKEKYGNDLNEFIKVGEIKNERQKYYLDLIGLNHKILVNYGLLEKNIYSSEICTYCYNDKYHSYRSNQTKKRNISLITL